MDYHRTVQTRTPLRHRITAIFRVARAQQSIQPLARPPSRKVLARGQVKGGHPRHVGELVVRAVRVRPVQRSNSDGVAEGAIPIDSIQTVRRRCRNCAQLQPMRIGRPCT